MDEVKLKELVTTNLIKSKGENCRIQDILSTENNCNYCFPELADMERFNNAKDMTKLRYKFSVDYLRNKDSDLLFKLLI